MEFLHPMNWWLRLIHAMDAHIHASSILIRKQNVGIVDVWVNVLHHAHHHVQHHVMVDVSITMNSLEVHLKQVKVEDAQLVVH
jgi:hypothetical protein